MNQPNRTPWQYFGILLIAGLVPAASPERSTDQTDLKAASVPGTIEVDVLAMFDAGDLRTGEVVDDPVWIIEADDEDEQLVEIPLIFKPGTEPLEVKSSTVRLRGGRLLAYRFDNTHEAARESRLRSRRGGGAGPPGFAVDQFGPPGDVGFGDPRSFTPDRFGPPGRSRSPRGTGRPTRVPRPDDPATRAEQPEDDIDPNMQMPQLTRRFTVTSEGKIQWKLNRSIPKGIVQDSDNLYALMLDPELMESKINSDKADARSGDRRSRTSDRSRSRGTDDSRQTRRRSTRQSRAGRGGLGGIGDLGSIPGGPNIGRSESRSRRGRTGRSGRGRRSDAETLRPEDRRAQLEMARELKRSLVDLPTKFEAPLPRRVWAIYQTPTSEAQFEIHGLSTGPWVVNLDWLDRLHNLGSVARRDSNDEQGLPTQVTQRVESLRNHLAKNPHPQNYRIIAYALNRAQLSAFARPGDSLYQLCAMILEGPDTDAQQVLIEDLVSTVPLSEGSYSLLKMAKNLDPQAKLMLLRGLLHANLTDPRQLQDVLAATNQTLADPEAPDPREILYEIWEAVQDRPDAVMMLVGGVRFDHLPQQRRDKAIAVIVEHAGSDQLAAGWLDQHLIGSTNRQLVQRTLEIIRDAGPVSMRPVVHQLLDLVFGHPSRPAGSEPALHATINQPLIIDSAGHSIIRTLQNADPDLRRLAWQALPRFTFGHMDTRRTSRSRGRGRGRTREPVQVVETHDTYSIVVNAGLTHSPHPVELVRFLVAQPDHGRVADSFVQIILQGDHGVAREAARTLLGSGQPLEESVGVLSNPEQAQFAGTLYEVLEDDQTLVTGLLRYEPSDRRSLVSWFTGYVSAGELPDASLWVEGFGGEAAVVELISSDDEQIVLASLAALVAHAGGNEATAPELAEKLRSEPEKQGAAAFWAGARQEIYLQRLQAAAGAYRLMVKVYGTAAPVKVTPARGSRSRSSRSRRGSGRPAGRQPGVPGAPGGPGFGGPPGGPGFGGPPGGPGFGGPGGPGFGRPGGARFGRGTARVTQDQSMPTGVPDLLIDLGVVTLEADGQSVSLANNALALSLPQEQLALRIQNPGELKNFPDDKMAQLPLEMVNEPIDLTSWPNGSWQGLVEMPDTRTAVIALEPERED